MVLFSSKSMNSSLFRRRRKQGGQALIEYLLMTLMLLALFTGLYKVLQSQLRVYFQKAGTVILTAYY